MGADRTPGGKFDFALVDSQIQDAQTYNLRLVFLWFGSWKNGVSSYIPAWVKTNQERFFHGSRTRMAKASRPCRH